MPDHPDATICALGIEIAPEYVGAALIEAGGTILEYNGAPFVLRAEYSGPSEGWRRARQLAVELGQDALASGLIPLAQVRACGVAAHGAVRAGNGEALGQWEGIPGVEGANLPEALAPALRLPVAARGVGACAAYAEARFGAGQGHERVIYAALAEEIFGGVSLQGRVFDGARCRAGGLAHISIDYRGQVCSCGARGCLQTEAGGPAIREALIEAAADYPESVFGRYVREGQRLGPEHLFSGVAEGDAVAQRLCDRVTEAIAAALQTVFRLLDPDIAVVYCPWPETPELLPKLLCRRMTFPAGCGGESVVAAHLGQGAAMIGAATLALTEASHG